MRYGIISDIHGNLEALETAIEALSREGIDEYLCVGDIVGYGADPAACIEKTKALNPRIVCGNHDIASVNLRGIENFNEAAREAVMWTRRELKAKDAAFLKGLDLVYKNERLTLAHGTLHEPGKFHYMSDKDASRATFSLMDTPLCFVGHSHIPGFFSYKSGKLSAFYKDKVRLSEGEKLIVNTGSVGQPRDGDPRLCYSVYDADEASIELTRVPYDIAKAQKKIMDAGLAPFLARRLSKGL